MNRRTFLSGLLASAAGLLLPKAVKAAVVHPNDTNTGKNTVPDPESHWGWMKSYQRFYYKIETGIIMLTQSGWAERFVGIGAEPDDSISPFGPLFQEPGGSGKLFSAMVCPHMPFVCSDGGTTYVVEWQYVVGIPVSDEDVKDFRNSKWFQYSPPALLPGFLRKRIEVVDDPESVPGEYGIIVRTHDSQIFYPAGPFP